MLHTPQRRRSRLLALVTLLGLLCTLAPSPRPAAASPTIAASQSMLAQPNQRVPGPSPVTPAAPATTQAPPQTQASTQAQTAAWLKSGTCPLPSGGAGRTPAPGIRKPSTLPHDPKTPVPDLPPGVQSAGNKQVMHWSSGVNPYDIFDTMAHDEVFIGDHNGLLERYLYNDSGMIYFNIPISRYYGPITQGSYLANPEAAVENGILPATVQLALRVYDVDDDYQGNDVLPERDEVLLNGYRLPMPLSSGNNNWNTWTVDIPITCLLFPNKAAAGESITPQRNILQVLIDVDNPDPTWAVEVEWGRLIMPGVRPLILVNGILSNEQNAWGTFERMMDNQGVPYWGISVGGWSSIASNTEILSTQIPIAKRAMGVERVNIVAHSKGGLDSRSYLRSHRDVDALIQIATPNRGSDPAGILPWWSLEAQIQPFHDLRPDWLHDNFNCVDLRQHFWQPHQWVLNAPELYTMYYQIYAGTHFASAGWKGLYPPHDGWVSTNRATPPWFWDCSAPTSRDHDGEHAVVSARGDYDHTSIHESADVEQQVLQWLKESRQGGFGLQGGPAGAASPIAGMSSPAAGTATLAAGMSSPAPAGGAQPQSEPNPEQVVAAVSGQFADNLPIDLPVPLQGNQRVQFIAMYSAGSPSLQLTDPAGHTITPASLPAGADFQTDDLGGGMYTQTLTLPNPADGLWHLRWQNAAPGAPAEARSYGLAAIVQDGPMLAVDIPTGLITTADALPLTATLADPSGAPISGYSGSIAIKLPDGSSQSLTLAETAAGQYQATFTPPMGGEYGLVFQLAKAGGTSRMATGLLEVSTSAAHLTGQVDDQGVDVDGDGLFDTLSLPVHVQVDRAGDYTFDADLLDDAGRLIQHLHYETAGNGGPLAQGDVILPLQVPGNILRGVGDTHFTLTTAILRDASQGGVLLQAIDSLHTTGLYLASQWQRLPILMPGPNRDEPEVGADGTYTGILLYLGVDVLHADWYKLQGRVVDADGQPVAWINNWYNLQPGATTLLAQIDGQRIRQNGKTTSYTLQDVEIMSYYGHHTLNVLRAYTTGVYDISRFSPIPTDLVVTGSDLTFSPVNPAAGSPVTLTATVHNYGRTTDGTFAVDYFLGDPDNGGSLLGSVPVAGLAADSTATVNLNVTAPGQPGSYDYFVAVNRSRSVSELSYTNNKADAYLTVASGHQPPTTTATLSGMAGNAPWYTSPVTVTLAATPGSQPVARTEYRIGSGAWQTYTGPFTLATDGVITLGYHSIDSAGLTETEQQEQIHIDQSRPSLALAALPAVSYVGDRLTLQYTATDATSGVASSAATFDGAPVSNGQSVSPGAGWHTWRVTATDAAGNQQASTVRIRTMAHITWLPPLQTPPTWPVGQTMPVRLQVLSTSGSFVHDESVRITISAVGSSVPWVSYDYGTIPGKSVLIDDAAGTYAVDFLPAAYGIPPGPQGIIRVYLGGILQSSQTFTLQ